MLQTKYKSKTYNISEIKGSITYSNHFKGLIFTIPISYELAPIIITFKEDPMKYSLGSDIKFKKVDLLDFKYKKVFNLYLDKISNSSIDNILKNVPISLFEYLLTLNKIYKSKKIKCAIFQNKIIISINIKKQIFATGNLFISCFNTDYNTKFVNNIQNTSKHIEYLLNFQKSPSLKDTCSNS